MSTLGDIIKDFRTNRDDKITMEKFADMTGLSKGYISLLERGYDQRGNVIKPSLQTISQVANAMDISLQDLLTQLGDSSEIVNNITQNTNNLNLEGQNITNYIIGETNTMNEVNVNKVFSTNLNNLLYANQMTRIDLAKQLDVNPMTVGSWCRGEKTPKLETLYKIMQILNCTSNELIPYPKKDPMKVNYLIDTDSNDVLFKTSTKPVNISKLAIELHNIITIQNALKEADPKIVDAVYKLLNLSTTSE